MSTSHKDLAFSFSQNMLLLRIKLFGLSAKFARTNRHYRFLFTYALIENSPKNPKRFVLSEKARMYIRYKRRSNLRFLIPVVISIIALFGGYDVYTNPLLERILQEIALLAKTITKNLDAFLQMIF